jgi:DHA2 family multidrug resistance protein
MMFCLLPPTRLAPGNLDKSRVADVRRSDNLMRNLGGAIGLTLIDTMLCSRSAIHGTKIVNRLRVGGTETAKFTGLPDQVFAGLTAGPPSAAVRAMSRPLVERAAITQAINEAWSMTPF